MEHPTRICSKLWGLLARSHRRQCPTFEKAARTEYSPELAAALFAGRRDERACRAAVLKLAREGGAIVRGPRWSLDSADGRAPSPLRDRASVIAWMETHHLLDEHSPGEVLPEEVRFACERGRVGGNGAEDYLLRLALRWPGRGSGAAREWYIQQTLGAARRGAEWHVLLYEIVGNRTDRIVLAGSEPHATDEDAVALVDEIAWRSFGTDVEAPWVGYSVCRALNRREPDAWERAFRYLERRDLHFNEAQINKTLRWARTIAALHGNKEDVEGSPIPHGIPGWILLQAPLPSAPPDSFDEQLLFFSDTVQTEFPLTPLSWVARLAQLPLTRSRASRLLASVLAEPRHFPVIRPELLIAIVEAADPPPAELLPSAEAFLVSHDPDAGRLSAYRKLAGVRADELLRQWIRSPLDAPDRQLGGGPWNAACRMQVIPDLAPEGLVEEIVERVRRKPFVTILSFQKAFPQLMRDELVLQIARTRVDDSSESWAPWENVTLPVELAELVLERCRTAISSLELVRLSHWLLKLGRNPREVLSCLLGRAPRPQWDWQTRPLLRDILCNRSSWETFGTAIVEAMLTDGAKGELWSLVTEVTSERNGEVPQGIVVAIHEALAVALLKRAAAAVEAGDETRAIPPLHALVALHPPARLSSRLPALIARAKPGGEAHELAELNLRLMKRSKTRDAQPADVLGALQLLTEARAI